MRREKIADLAADSRLAQEFYDDLAHGAVAVIPTDTLYGFAVAADNKAAVAKVYAIKNRDAQKPLILFLDSPELLPELQFEIAEDVFNYLKISWPGALTAILPRPEISGLEAFSFSTIGVRVPDHQYLNMVLRKLHCYLLTTSANRSGDPSDTDPDKIAAEFSSEIDWLVDGGVLCESLPSTVVNFTTHPPQVLRQGCVSFQWPPDFRSGKK